jgi:DNA-directed RNA polymerase subunit RPC12/RpoP
MIEFSCHSCGKEFSVKDELAGKKGKCAACGEAIVVPSPDIDFDAFEDIPRGIGMGPDPVAAAMEDVNRAATTATEPIPQAKSPSYKVLTLRDKWFGGKFDPAKLEEALNDHAKRGWRLKAAVSASVVGMVGMQRDEIVFILER